MNSHAKTLRNVLASVANKLATLKQYFEDDAVTEIMINNPGTVFVERAGQVIGPIRTDFSDAQVEGAIRVIAGLAGKTVGSGPNEKPILSARLPGLRIEAVLPPVAIDGPSMCIRRISARLFSLQDYVDQKRLDPELVPLLQKIVHERSCVLIAGGTGSAKTTMLNTLVQLVDPKLRVLVAETVAELNISVPNHVRLEAENGVPMRDLIKTVLRYYPKIILIGEVRGADAYDLLVAVNTGHRGSMATIHANSATDALKQMEVYASEGCDLPFAAIRERIASAFQYVLFMSNETGVARLHQIVRLDGLDNATGQYLTQTLYQL